MNTYKKIGIGLALLVAVLGGLIAFGPHQKARAATSTPVSLPKGTSVSNVTFTFQDSGTIKVDFPDGTSLNFVDTHPLDGNHNYTSDGSNFCTATAPGPRGATVTYNGDAVIDGFNNNDVTLGATQANPVPAQITFNALEGVGNCVRITASNIKIDNSNQASNIYLVANNGGLADVSTPPKSYTVVPNTNNQLYAVDPTDTAGCYGGTVVFLGGDTHPGSSPSATVYDLSKGTTNLASSDPAIGQYFTNSVCAIKDQHAGVGVSGAPGTVQAGAACTSGTDCNLATDTCNTTGGDCTNGTGATTPSCESNASAISLSWILCPILSEIDSGAGAFNQFIENQLCFNTGASSTGGAACPGQNNLTTQVQQAWAVFRVIATALLVIIMLIMVVSQALGGGPFDAYTVRKLLPKLVAAVILIQLSWVLTKWAIDLSNDLGRGIADLMFAPFGGEGNIDLAKMVGNGVAVATGGGSTDSAFQFFAVIAGAGIALANIPGLLALGVFVLFSLATGFFVLVLRKILIIFLVILAPVAFILWILPGTETYWKMWRENFMKILLMFPLIEALIAAGKIFAYISSGSSTGTIFQPHLAIAHFGSLPVPYVATATGFADLAIIVFAYFGPFLLLPKTFSWGGSLMGSASRAVQSSQAASNLRNKTSEGAKGFGQRNVTGRFAKRYSPDAGRLSRIGNSVMGGRILPTKYRQALLAQAGDKWDEERKAEANAVMKRGGEKARNGYQTKLRMDDGSEAVYDRAPDDPTDTDPATGLPRKRYYSKQFREDKTGPEFTDDVSLADKRKALPGEEGDMRTLKGVAAMKQYWVDKTEDGKDEYEKKVAVDLLTSTSSWPEMQGSFTKNGKRVGDTDIFNKTITTSVDNYPKILRSRVDLAPHLDDKAKTDLPKEIARIARARQSEAARGVPEDQMTPELDQAGQQDYVSARRMLYAVRDQMSNEDFSTQSDGFWEEMKRVSFKADGTISDQGKEIRRNLQDRFKAIQAIGGTAPAQALGHLASGGSLQKNVNAVLTGNAKADVGEDGGVIDFIGTSGRGAGGATGTGGTTGTPTVIRPGVGAILGSSPGEIKVAHEEAVQNVIPSAASISVPGPAREAYKARLRSDPTTAQTLVGGLAYGTIQNTTANPDRAAHMGVLQELHNDAVAPGASSDSKDQINGIVNQLISTLSQRTTEAVQQAVAEGKAAGLSDTDIDARRVRIQNASAAQIANYETLRVP